MYEHTHVCTCKHICTATLYLDSSLLPKHTLHYPVIAFPLPGRPHLFTSSSYDLAQPTVVRKHSSTSFQSPKLNDSPLSSQSFQSDTLIRSSQKGKLRMLLKLPTSLVTSVS